VSVKIVYILIDYNWDQFTSVNKECKMVLCVSLINSTLNTWAFTPCRLCVYVSAGNYVFYLNPYYQSRTSHRFLDDNCANWSILKHVHHTCTILCMLEYVHHQTKQQNNTSNQKSLQCSEVITEELKLIYNM